MSRRGLAAIAIATLLIAGILIAGVVVAAGSGPDDPPARPDFAWVDSLVRTEALDRGVPGVAVAIVTQGQILLARGYGVADRDTGRPVVESTPFNIASLTKPFTSMAAVRLARRGDLDLDASVRRYVDDLPGRYEPVTIRHLLTHTSGVDRDVRVDNFDDPDAAEYRARVDTASMHAEPGERWEYANTGYTLLGWAVAAAAGRPLADVYAEEIFAPAGMDGAAYRVPAEEDAERARPHQVVDGETVDVPYVSGGFASGGLSMSALDLGRFAAALQRGELLDPAELDRVWSPATLRDGQRVTFEMMEPDASYGFGWFLTRYEGRRLYTHGGGIEGFSSNLYHFPDEGVTIVVLANVKARDDGRAPVDPLARAIARACFERQDCGVIGSGRESPTTPDR